MGYAHKHLNNKKLKIFYFNEPYWSGYKKIYNVSKETLGEFYVSPIKLIKNKEFIKLKLIHSELKTVSKGMRVKCKVHISGMWFSESSFGCYFNVLNLEIIENVKKPLFLEDSESEIEINV